MIQIARTSATRASEPLVVVTLLYLLLGIAAYCFWPALTGPFIFDDIPNLENLRQLNYGVSIQSIGQYLAAANGSLGRPLSMLSFMIEDNAWPAMPLDYKRNNLLLHLLTAVLVFTLLRALARTTDLSDSTRNWVALMCTAAWLLNPMQLSATMLVVQRMNILATLFTLAGLIIYLHLLEQAHLSALKRASLGISALAVFGFLALLCKENGVLIVAYAGVINLTFARSTLAQLTTPARRIIHMALAIPLVSLCIAPLVFFEQLQYPYRIRAFSLYERLITEPRILFDYLGNIFIPRLGGQGILHDDYIYSTALLSPPSTLLAIIALSGLTVLAIRFRRSYSIFSFAVFWFLGGHLIESSIIGLELYFEHRNYLPMIGPLFAVGIAAARLPNKLPRVAAALFAAWLLAAAALTHLNAATWGSRALQSQVWLQEHPKSPRAVQWAASYRFDHGDIAGARTLLASGAARIPAAMDLRLQVVLVDCLTTGNTPGQWQEAIALFQQAPYSHLTPMIFATLVEQALGPACQGSLSHKTLFNIADALLGNHAYQQIKNSLSFIHYELSKIYIANRDLDKTIYHLDLAYQYNSVPSIPREQAIHLLSAGNPGAALHYLRISNSTSQPWFKSLVQDVPAINAPLIRSAERMQRDLAQEQKSNERNADEAENLKRRK